MEIFCPLRMKCRKLNSFTSRQAYEQHLKVAHPDVSVNSLESEMGLLSSMVLPANATRSPGNNREVDTEYEYNDQMDLCDEDSENEDTLHTASANAGRSDILEKEPVGNAPEFERDDTMNPYLYKGTLNEVERDLAAWAFKNEISNSSYESLAKLMQKALAKAQESSRPYYISTTSLDDVKKRLEAEASPIIKLPFQDRRVQLQNIEDFPQLHREEFESVVGEIHFSYRDIKKVCEHLFSHPAFWNVMINKPTIYRRHGERVYTDFDSGEWWEELQLKYPGNIILTIMLSSDQTIVSGNGRHKAWPLYIKLGNVPMKYRNSDKFKATRVLAYLPVIDWKTSTSSPPWLSNARISIFHYCLSLAMEPFKSLDGRVRAFELMGPLHKKYRCIPALACYTADLPEQRMLAIVKGGNSLFSCPRCHLPTSDFHLPCTCEVGTGGAPVRTKEYMMTIYMYGKQLRDSKQSVEQLCSSYSTHIIQNTFWSLPLFDIYESLTVDDLHQLGEVYQHLVGCVEKMIKNMPQKNYVLKRISKRASMTSPFQDLRLFRRGYMLSALKNPTYSELKDHMSVLLTCVSKDLPLQASLCLRAFVDFFHLANLKQHTSKTIDQMNATLKEFDRLVPVFEQYSASKLRFPKHHMLWKYSNDIRRYSVASVYSSCQSEHQHRIDAKRPGRRTNYHKYKMTSQMGKFVHYRDLVYDQYGYYVITQVMEDTIAHNSLPSITRRQLVSQYERGKSLSFTQIQRDNLKYPMIVPLARCCLHTMAKGANTTCSLHDMPEIVDYSAQVTQQLDLYGVDGNWQEYRASLRAHKKFHGYPRYDFAMFNDGSVGQLLLFFTIKPRRTAQYSMLPESVDLCLVRRFTFSDAAHLSGFRVLVEPESTRVYDKYVVLQVSQVIRAVHIEPDFSTALNDQEEDGIYAQYLWNYDVDPSCNVRGTLPVLENSITWTPTPELTSTQDEASSDDGEHDDDSDAGYSDSVE